MSRKYDEEDMDFLRDIDGKEPAYDGPEFDGLVWDIIEEFGDDSC